MTRKGPRARAARCNSMPERGAGPESAGPGREVRRKDTHGGRLRAQRWRSIFTAHSCPSKFQYQPCFILTGDSHFQSDGYLKSHACPARNLK